MASVKTLLLLLSLFESQKHLFQFPYLKIVFSDQLCFSNVVSISKCLYLSFENVLWKLLFIVITVIEPNISAEECRSCSLALTPMYTNVYTCSHAWTPHWHVHGTLCRCGHSAQSSCKSDNAFLSEFSWSSVLEKCRWTSFIYWAQKQPTASQSIVWTHRCGE